MEDSCTSLCSWCMFFSLRNGKGVLDVSTNALSLGSHERSGLCGYRIAVQLAVLAHPVLHSCCIVDSREGNTVSLRRGGAMNPLVDQLLFAFCVLKQRLLVGTLWPRWCLSSLALCILVGVCLLRRRDRTFAFVCFLPSAHRLLVGALIPRWSQPPRWNDVVLVGACLLCFASVCFKRCLLVGAPSPRWSSVSSLEHSPSLPYPSSVQAQLFSRLLRQMMESLDDICTHARASSRLCWPSHGGRANVRWKVCSCLISCNPILDSANVLQFSSGGAH